MRRGGGRKVRALPRKFVFLAFGREGTCDVLGILPGYHRPLGVFKKLVQKRFVRIFRFPNYHNLRIYPYPMV